jgi:hypothetical protein
VEVMEVITVCGGGIALRAPRRRRGQRASRGADRTARTGAGARCQVPGFERGDGGELGLRLSGCFTGNAALTARIPSPLAAAA